MTYRYLRSHEKNGARFLFNTYLPKPDGETTEIDVMLIHESGIFVFESKNYSGWIFGGETQKTWTQCLPKGKGRSSQKEHFLNPIFQNKLHISTLKKIINKDVPIYSIVVFSERCTLKNITVSEPTVRVINRNEVPATVNRLSAGSTVKLSQDDIDSLYDTLFPYSQVSDEIKQNHIRTIQNNIQEKQADLPIAPVAAHSSPESPDQATETSSPAANDLNCPLCGGKLILRTGTRGNYIGKQFYGCSNFPHCRYIRNL